MCLLPPVNSVRGVLSTLFRKKKTSSSTNTPADTQNSSTSSGIEANEDNETIAKFVLKSNPLSVTLRENDQEITKTDYNDHEYDLLVAAIKNFGEKAEGVIEQQKKNVQELVESQKEKIGEMLKSKTEEAASTAEATKTAIEGFEGELEKKAEQTVDEGLQKVSATVDEKLKQTEGFLDEKREEVAKTLNDKTETAASAAAGPAAAALEKAKGLIKF